MQLSDKTVFIPHLSDHAYPVAAAMRAYGQPAEVLPSPNAETMEIGRDLCRGRECLPCFLCAGDLIRRARQPGFDASRSLYFMPGGPGPCRLPQYSVLQREILDQLGLAEVGVMAPDSQTGYALFGPYSREARMLCAAAIAAVDILIKAVHELRPYEIVPGATEAAYARSLARLVSAVEHQRMRGLRPAMEWAAGQFAIVPVNRAERRPLIGVLGEAYVLLNSYSNRNLVHSIEAAGGEVLMGIFLDVLDMTETNRAARAWRTGMYRVFTGAEISRLYQRMVLRRAYRPFRHLLSHPLEASLRAAYARLHPLYDTELGTESVLTMSRALDISRHGVSGIINVLPFQCMPGLIVVGMGPRLRQTMGGMPWLDISYDAQESTNITTRLEAFMHQVSQFARRQPRGRRHAATRESTSGDLRRPGA